MKMKTPKKCCGKPNCDCAKKAKATKTSKKKGC